MDIQDWLILQKLSQYKNITKTAEKLFMSQPALTARIKKIENYFQVPLIIRHRRGIQFTSEGEYLVDWSFKILKQNEEIKDNINNMKYKIGGTLKIGASRYMSKYKLPKLLRLFKNKYSQIEFQVLTGWSGDIVKAITNRDVHVAFVRSDYPWSNKKDLLYEETLCVAYTKPFELNQLPNLPRIIYDTDQRSNYIVDKWWVSNFDKPPFVSINANNVDTCKEMIINGLGYGILPTVMVENYENIHKKVLFGENKEPLKRETWLYYHQDTMKINMVDAFINFVYTHF